MLRQLLSLQFILLLALIGTGCGDAPFDDDLLGDDDSAGDDDTGDDDDSADDDDDD